MSVILKGAVFEIQKVCVNSVRNPCYNHTLNLTLSKTSQVQAIRNCMGTIGEVVNSFIYPKRNHVLTQPLGYQLVSLGETRWVELPDSILTFLECFGLIIAALEIITEWNDQATATKANSLLTSITACEFIVALHTLAEIFSHTITLSRLLQKQDLCVDRAAEVMADLKNR